MSRITLLFFLVSFAPLTYSGIFNYLGFGSNQPETHTNVRIKGSIERSELLERLKTDLKEIESTQEDFARNIQSYLDQNTKAIEEIKEKQASASGREIPFFNKVLSLLNEKYQTLFNLQFFRKELINTLEQHITLLETFFKEPDFKSISIPQQSFYTFDNLQDVTQKITVAEDQLNHLTEQKNELGGIDNEGAKRKLAAITKELDEKKKQQSEFSSKLKDPKNTPAVTEFDFKQQGKLIDLEKDLLSFEKQLAELKVQNITRKLSLLETSLTLEADKLKIYKNNLIKIKDGLRIEPKDIQKAKNKLETLKKESLAKRDKLYATIKELSGQRDTTLKELEQLKKKYNLSDLSALGLASWNVTPATLQDWIKLSEIGLKDSQIDLLENKIDTVRAAIDLEVNTFKRNDIEFAILNSWYKITRRQFKTNDEILDDLKSYQSLTAELTREEASIKDKRTTLANLITLRSKNLINLKAVIAELKQSKDSVFKSAHSKYTYALGRFNQTEKIVEEQIENNNQLLKTYSDLVTLIASTQQDLNNITSELETKSIWQRSEYAISWNGVKNIGSDIGFFIKDVQKLFAHFIFGLYPSLRSTLSKILYHPFNLIVFIIKIIFLLFLYWFLKSRLISFIISHGEFKPANNTIFILSKILEFLSSFVYSYFTPIFLWVTAFCLIYFNYITDSFLIVLFYLGSIFLLCYFVYRLLQYLKKFNEQNNYVFFNQFFQKRFIFVFGLFSYLTIILLLLREAFIVATYHASEFPTILLAAYSVIIRTLLIFSIGKDELISLIPQKNTAWKTVSDFIDKYYYLLLGIIIVLMLISDPYVGGYGNLVSYVLWGCIGTVVLLKLLLFLQNYIKKKSSRIFFRVDEETIRERFAYAKTWYGLFVVALFVLFVALGIILSLKIWGKTISLQDVSSVLNYGMVSAGFDQTIQQHIWLTPLKIVVIILFIFAGFIIAFTINRFVLNKIFQLLPVDIGIQNTITSITRYLIFIAAIILGFNWGGLGSILLGLGLVVGSIGYIVKEPIGDFISYFIILVQRPLKIGDLVKVNDVLGVVRHITPRSVIIRAKNSYTIVMPNTMIINQPVFNWNYSRGFIAFDDITFTVPYTADPMVVKTIIAQVLDANTDILKSPRPIIRLENFGENGYEFMLRGFLSSNKTLDIWDIASNVRLSLVQALQKNGISIAIPTRLVLTKEAAHTIEGTRSIKE